MHTSLFYKSMPRITNYAMDFRIPYICKTGEKWSKNKNSTKCKRKNKKYRVYMKSIRFIRLTNHFLYGEFDKSHKFRVSSCHAYDMTWIILCHNAIYYNILNTVVWSLHEQREISLLTPKISPRNAFVWYKTWFFF